MSITITADKVINKALYAKQAVKGYASDLTTVKHEFSPGGLIGTVYSYIIDNAGDLYWMVYVDNYDYQNFNPTYIKHNAGSLSLPALPQILKEIQDQVEADKKAKLGVVPYYIEKYAPYIIVGVLGVMALPTITAAASPKPKIGAMTKDQQAAALLLTAGAVIWAIKRKKGSVIVDPLNPGEFLTDEQYQEQYGSHTEQPGQTETFVPTGSSDKIQYIGIFPVRYGSSQMIAGRKSDIGKCKTY